MIVINEEYQRKTSPEKILQLLKDGNNRFVTGRSEHKDLLKQAQTTASEGQFPVAVFLSCIDARTSIELIFDLGIGDVFNIKIAGNIINADILGSLEYACKVAGTKLIVVKGHTNCGAITAACKNEHFENITTLVNKINTPINTIKEEGKLFKNNNETFINEVAIENVKNSIKEIRKGSTTLRKMEENNEIMIVGAFHCLENGEVEFL